MEAFQERMVNEFKKLSGRVVKLENFILSNPLFDKHDKMIRQEIDDEIATLNKEIGEL